MSELRDALEGTVITCENRHDPVRYQVRIRTPDLASAQRVHNALVRLPEADQETDRLRRENDALRDLLARSGSDCPYCGLAASDMARCGFGFPGCSRADDLAHGGSPGVQELEFAVAQLRHAYSKLCQGSVIRQQEFAQGLIAPQIKTLEKILGESRDSGEN